MKEFLSLIGLLLFAWISVSEPVSPYNSTKGIAVRGYDVVAYFKVSKPVKGSDQFTHVWNNVTWLFSTSENRDAFAREPDKYAPQFGGYCAYAASRNYIYDADPNYWKIVDGKLYFNYNDEAKAEWEKDIPGNIKKGEANWPALLKGERSKS